MNSWERVFVALNKNKPDRVPVDFWAEPCVKERLLQDLGLKCLADILEYLNIDIRTLTPVEPAYKMLSQNTIENFWGERWKRVYHYGWEEWEHIQGALYGAKTLDDLKQFNWPTPDIIDYGVLKKQLEKYKGYAIKYGSSDIWERPCLVRGIEDFLCDMALRPEMAHFMIKKYTDFYCEDLTRALEVTKGQIDIYLTLSDVGTQVGPLISMDMFNIYIAPYVKRLFSIARAANVKTMFHSCGAVCSFIPAFIDMGMEILNPIQVRAKGMNPRKLKEEFGDRICFCGGIDIQKTLPQGSPDDVRKEVEKRIEELGYDGGYILSATHNIQIDTCTENILAMYDVNIR